MAHGLGSCLKHSSPPYEKEGKNNYMKTQQNPGGKNQETKRKLRKQISPKIQIDATCTTTSLPRWTRNCHSATAQPLGKWAIRFGKTIPASPSSTSARSGRGRTRKRKNTKREIKRGGNKGKKGEKGEKKGEGEKRE